MVHINQVGLHGPVDMNQLLHVLLLLAGKKKPGKVVRIILIKRVMQLGGNHLQRTQGNIIKDAVSAGFFVPAFPAGVRAGFTLTFPEHISEKVKKDDVEQEVVTNIDLCNLSL
ncbi:MAG: hypothetical protein KAK01_06005 [Candidatus Marinimicrobia bacterium]|nr:hypothetical protein [Candidatus Neomarinimicrobiota bacterium]